MKKEKMDVICLEEKAFYTLIEEVVERLSEKHNEPVERWIDGEEAMKLLKIKSKTTLQHMRDNDKVVYSQPSRKKILYDRFSIDKYLDNNKQSTF